MNNNKSEWDINTDIYGIVENIENLKHQYIDEDETTLSVGIFGFLSDTEAKKIQTAIIQTGELGNEMFPQRAKFDRNIIAHAIYCNVNHINAYPATMILNIAILESDINLYTNNDVFMFDSKCPIYVGEFEFHPDYDIRIRRTYSKKNDALGKPIYLYTAEYEMSEKNIISDINNPYLKQPYVQKINNNKYVCFQMPVRQVRIETTEDRMITDSIIDNRSYIFYFDDQLVDFDVYVTDNNITKRLKPLFYGSGVPAGTDLYCWYIYLEDNSIRLTFDANSFIPGLNSEIKIVSYTTKGAEGNFKFNYISSYTDTDVNGFYTTIESEYYDSRKIKIYVSCATESENGLDRKSIEELQRVIPKVAFSRGYITTEYDLDGYFNLISTEENRIKMQKKVDNQLNRIWYCYLVTKDSTGNIIPSNSIPLLIDYMNEEYSFLCDPNVDDDDRTDRRYVIPAGTTFVYDPKLKYAEYIPKEEIPELYSDEYYCYNSDDKKYYYRTFLDLVINTNPLYAAYYCTLINQDGYFYYNYENDYSVMGFIANTFHMERSLGIADNITGESNNPKEYRLSFDLQQSINDNDILKDYPELELIKAHVDMYGDVIITECNMKVFVVIFKDGAPYRYDEAQLVKYDPNGRVSSWQLSMITDDRFDTLNRIKILDMYEAGYDTKNYGYFEEYNDAYIVITGDLALSNPAFKYGSTSEIGFDIKRTIPIMENDPSYIVVDVYKLMNGGIHLFDNYTNIQNTKIKPTVINNKVINYVIGNIPVVGEHFFLSEDNATDFMNVIRRKKAYIDDCLEVLENNMDIDFKLFNTYGYSNTYLSGYTTKIGTSSVNLGNIDTTWRFRLQLVNTSDSATSKAQLISYIKDYVENLNDIGDFHVPNMIHDIKEEYKDLINYIEFVDYNDNAMGRQHILLKDVIDHTTVPEFICVRNYLDTDKKTLIPNIQIELILE